VTFDPSLTITPAGGVPQTSCTWTLSYEGSSASDGSSTTSLDAYITLNTGTLMIDMSELTDKTVAS
jgi:hypothetical protein